MAGLNNAEKPQDEDQDQQSAKTYIHACLQFLVVAGTTGKRPHRSSRFDDVMELLGVIFYPSANCRICLTFRPLIAISAPTAVPQVPPFAFHLKEQRHEGADEDDQVGQAA